MSKNILYYVYDPMCSWCWGFRPTWEVIQASLPDAIEVEFVLGGLAPDNDQPMSQAMREKLEATWHSIQNRLGTQFNFDYWRKANPRRSTYPACRAVIAAWQQGKGREMISAIQQAYYLRALNPSDTDTHVQLAKELGLDLVQFEGDLKSEATQGELMRQINLGQTLGAMGFPSLILEHEGQRHFIRHDYLDPEVTLRQIHQIISGMGAVKLQSI